MLNISRRSVPENLPNFPKVPPLLTQLFASRGVTSELELNYSAGGLHHFSSLGGLPEALALLHGALQERRKIIIVGDFDADGATSTCVLMLGLKMFGFNNLDFLVPNRFDFGYGLSPEIVDVAAEQGAQLIITVDNGISSINGVARAKASGIPVIITDHHLPGESLPQADAIINPNLASCAFPSKNLAGVGVAFYLLVALRAYFEENGFFSDNSLSKPNLGTLLDLVALGTVADVVPLDSNNRILVHQGLQRIRSGKCRPGITAMLEVANRQQNSIVASDLGFAVGPRLNAAGRLDDMTVGIQCLLADDTGTARRLALQLDQLNQERRAIEAEMQEDAQYALSKMALDEAGLPDGITLFEEHWHQGIVGILAGRIKDRFYRPTIAFALEKADVEAGDSAGEALLKGSGRSISGLHLRDLLEELNNRYPGLITKFGGHAAAAGLTIRAADFQQFKTVFEAICREKLTPEALSGELVTDGELLESHMTLDVAQQLRQAGPWGQAFPEPVFDGIFALETQRIVGHKHLKMQVKLPSGQLFDAIAFNIDVAKWPNPNTKRVQLVYKLDINEFRGRRSVQLLVDALAAVS